MYCKYETEFCTDHTHCSTCSHYKELELEGTITVNVPITNIGYSLPCIICDESVKLTEREEMSVRHGHHIPTKVCDKCKKAILYIRTQIKENE